MNTTLARLPTLAKLYINSKIMLWLYYKSCRDLINSTNTIHIGQNGMEKLIKNTIISKITNYKLDNLSMLDSLHVSKHLLWVLNTWSTHSLGNHEKRKTYTVNINHKNIKCTNSQFSRF